MAGLFQESDGSTSSRRVAAFLFPLILIALGAVIAVLGIVFNADKFVPIAGVGVIALGVIVILFMFNFINATNISEIVGKVKNKDAS